MALLGAVDRLLAGDHEHRHGTELGVGGGGDEVGRAGAERGQADAGLAGESAIGGGHEAGGLLVAGQHQPDRGARERVEQVEVFLARHAVDGVHTLVFEAADKEVGCVDWRVSCPSTFSGP